MIFGSPIWLTGLVAWGLLAAWMLWGRWPRAVVPYLPLWLAGNVVERPRRQFEMPPKAIVALLGAGAMAIFAASEPALLGRAGTGRTVTVIVDRGLTMSGSPSGANPRFVQAADSANRAIDDVAPGAKVVIHMVPPVPGASEEGRADLVATAPPTAMADPEALALTCRRAIANTPGLVVLVSNQAVPVEDPRLVQVTPDQALNGAGIDSLEVVGPPHPQAMVRITNLSDSSSAKLTVHSDDQAVDEQITLPQRGIAKNYFVDLPSAGKVIEADLTAEGDALLDQKAWSVQRSVWPKIEAETGIIPELIKMVSVYGQLRPVSADSPLVSVTSNARALNGDSIVAYWANPQPDDVPVQSSQGLHVATSPFSTADVNWDDILSNATASRTGPEGDWVPIVTVGKFVLVAARDRPVRQVWVGFQAQGFADRADFVVFWGEVFNWLGNAGPVFSAQNCPSPDGSWVPVLYQAPDGAVTAYNAPPIPDRLAEHLEWRDNLAKLPPRLRVGERPFSSELLLGALLLVCIAAATWRVGTTEEEMPATRYSARRQG
jgi:hypothetical protein